MVKGTKKAAFTVTDYAKQLSKEVTKAESSLEELKKQGKAEGVELEQISIEAGEKPKVSGYVRVQARVSMENFKFIEAEAERTGTTISAIASIYIADGVLAYKKKQGKSEQVNGS